jgi:L-fucose mutarotase
MLKGLDPLLDAELLYLLAAMGHGDDLALVDRNFPADSVARATVSGQLVRQDGVDTTAMARAILSLFPLDSFVDAPVQRMEVVGEPETLLEVHQDMQRVANQAEGREVTMASLERFAFYEAAKGAYAVVATAEARPYGCFILKKGVVFD